MAQMPAAAFIDLRPALREAKAHERVYYKTDSHWNYNGAMAGYDVIMREVQRAAGARAAAGNRCPRNAQRTLPA